jgi:hypothetical protein
MTPEYKRLLKIREEYEDVCDKYLDKEFEMNIMRWAIDIIDKHLEELRNSKRGN